MSEGKRDDQPLALDVSDEALAAVLPAVAARQAPDPAFRARLEQRLREAAAVPEAAPAAVPLPPRRRPRLNAAGGALAFLSAAAAVAVVLGGSSPLPLAPVSATVPAGEPASLRAPAGRSVGVAIGAPLVARLELRDGAQVSYRPGDPPRLELVRGYLRVAAGAALVIRAAGAELTADPGADVALELQSPSPSIQGGNPMRSVWLIPTSAAAGAAVTLAIMVAQGRVVLGGTKPAAAPPPGQVLVLHPEDNDLTLAQARRRLAETEQKVTALREENGRLAGRLAQNKGVTKASVLERAALLTRRPLGALLAPGALADLVTDLKGLGAQGVQIAMDMLKSKDENERFLAAKLLEDLNAPAAISALRDAALNDSAKMPRNMASHALALMDDAGTVPALREIAAAKGSWETEVNALWGLCKHGDEKGITDALAFVKDDKRSKQARGALGANLMLLPDPELMPIVDETVRQFEDSAPIGTMAVGYYKGVPEGRARLEAMAKNPKHDASVRKAAEDALAPAPAPAR